MKATFHNLVETIRDEPKRVLYWLVGGLALFYVLRGCFPSLSSDTLPPDVLENIQRSNINCISVDDTPILPGYPRQPECGFFEVEMAEKGHIPPSAQETGVSQAICYRITVENPRWQTMGGVRMDITWSSQSFSKVATLQNGEWRSFPDEDLQDEQRWIDYGCPGSYLLE